MRFTNKQYVRWGDLDAFGHVNNSTYLIFAQEARYAWSKMIEMVVARAEVDFIAPITPVTFILMLKSGSIKLAHHHLVLPMR